MTAAIEIKAVEKRFGNVGIIHIDRHIDIQEKDMDERMHTTPWFWTTHEGTVTTHRDHSHMHDVGLPNCHPKNLVQVGIGGWYGKTIKVNNDKGASVNEMLAISSLGQSKVRRSIAILLALTFSKHFYLVSITSFYIFYLIHTFNLTVQSAQVHLFIFLGAVAAGRARGQLGDAARHGGAFSVEGVDRPGIVAGNRPGSSGCNLGRRL